MQRLNLARGQAQEAFEDQRASRCEDENEYLDEGYGEHVKEEDLEPRMVDPSESRWTDLARAADIAEGKYEHPVAKAEDDLEDEFEIVTALPDERVFSKKRGRKPRGSGSRGGGGGAGFVPAAAGGISKPDSGRNAKSLFFPRSRPTSGRSWRKDSPTLDQQIFEPNGMASNALGNDDDFFTTAPADLAFEDEVMP